MRYATFLLFILLITGPLAAQEKDFKGLSNQVSLSIQFPFGEFAETHYPGVGLEFFRNAGNTGRLVVMPRGDRSFYYGGNLIFFPGKEETISNEFNYTYKHFLMVHIKAGMSFHFNKTNSASLSMGPGVAIYRKNARLQAQMELNYTRSLGKKWSVSPLLQLMSQAKTNTMVTAGVKAGYAF